MESKNVVVLGGTRGFGFELAKVFADKGCNLVVTGRRGMDAAEAASKIGASTPGAVKVLALRPTSLHSPRSSGSRRKPSARSEGSICSSSMPA